MREITWTVSDKRVKVPQIAFFHYKLVRLDQKES